MVWAWKTRARADSSNVDRQVVVTHSWSLVFLSFPFSSLSPDTSYGVTTTGRRRGGTAGSASSRPTQSNGRDQTERCWTPSFFFAYFFCCSPFFLPFASAFASQPFGHVESAPGTNARMAGRAVSQKRPPFPLSFLSSPSIFVRSWNRGPDWTEERETFFLVSLFLPFFSYLPSPLSGA